MGDHRVYRDNSYDLGNQLLILRTRIALTQIALAEQLGVHRRSVQKWETGLSYPKAEMLQRLIAVFLGHHAFTPGNERAEALALWEQAARDGPHPLPPFDEVWFARSLAFHITAPAPTDREQEQALGAAPPPPAKSDTPPTFIDWGEATAVPTLYGRESELETLQQWLVDERCRVVAILGLGGMGKSSLAITLAHQVLSQFEVVLFRTLQNGPPLAEVLDQVIYALSDQQAALPNQVSDKTALLIQLLRQRRCLLILDNYEAIMQPGALAGAYRSGYTEYGTLLHALSEREHHSSVVLTSREKPAELGRLEGRRTPVRSLQLSGLADTACRLILEARDITGTATDLRALARLYDGNPLALSLVSEPIHELFGGDVGAFLAAGDAFFNGMGQLLAQHFGRSTPLEQTILYWLAIERELVPFSALLADLGEAVPQHQVLAALESLRRRLLIERAPDRPAFTLQPVILEYATDQLVEAVYQEIMNGQPNLLHRHALVQATAKEYVRHSQEQLIARPLLERLGGAYGDADALERQLLTLIASWREQPRIEQGYGPGNVINLLRLLRGHLRGLDLSRVAIRQAYLQGVDIQDTNLVGAMVQDCVFTETFDAMTAVAISSRGEYWAAASRRGEIRVWNAGGQTLRGAWRAHADMVWALAFSPDGQRLASGSWDGSVKLWDVNSGSLLWTGRHTSHVNGVAFSADGSLLASSGIDATVRLWDVQSGAQLQLLPHPTPVTSVMWSAEGQVLASGDDEGYIRLWTVDKTEAAVCVKTIRGHTDWVDALAFAPDTSALASASWDGAVKLWEVSSGHLQQTLSGHTDRVGRLAWSSDGRTLASGGRDQTIWLWDVVQRSYRAALYEHSGPIYGLAFTPDSRSLLSGSEDGTVRVWDMGSGQCIRVIQGYAAFLYVVDWSPDGAQLVSGSMDTLVTIWDANGGVPPRSLQGHTGHVCGVAWSPDGRWLASSEWDNALRLWDSTSGVCLQVLQHPDYSGNCFFGLAWRPDGQRLAAGTYRFGAKVFDMTAPGHRWDDPVFQTAIRPVAWRPDGAQLAGGGDDGAVYVWGAEDGALLYRLPGHHSMITSVSWSPSGTRLASGSGSREGGELFIWDVQSGERVRPFAEPPGIVSAVAWGASEDVLVSGGSNGNLRWWDMQSGGCVRVRQAHQGTVQALRRSPDGTKLASCGDDGAIMLWDLASGEYLQTLRRDRPYERLDITDLTGITAAQRASLLALGAVERPLDRAPPLATTPHSTVADQPTDGDQKVASSLLSQSTSFIGRSAELAAIARRLADPQCRLLTLLGPGGIGKTRLALAVVADQIATFADGVAFVALASVSTPDQIVSAIGESLQLDFASQPDPTAHLLGYLRERHMLLVLDNFEHLLDPGLSRDEGGADLVAAILAHAPHLTLVVTSRERLNLQAEWLFDIDGLAYPHQDTYASSAPHPLTDLTEYSAVQLFVQRARQVQPELALDEATLTTIVQICQHVAGMPLAIELAAAGVRSLPLAEIERQLRANLDMLATSLRDVPARHRSMRAIFDHSWRLLNEEERALFSHLAVFRGGWTAEAAEQVAGATIDVLTALVDKSLVRQSRAEPRSIADRAASHTVSEPRFVMLEPIREYALEQLVARGEEEIVRHAHATYYLALAEAAAAQWDSPTAEVAIAQLDREYDNLRAALRWACDGGDHTIGLRLAEALWQFWRSYGYASEGRVWLEQLLALEDNPTDRTALAARQRGLHAAAWLASDQHEYAQAARLFEQSMALLRTLGEGESETDLMLNAARQARTEGDYQRATALFEHVLAWHRAQGYDIARGSITQEPALYAFGQVLRELGLVTREQGDFAQARALFEENLALHQIVGDRASVGFALIGLADVARDQGDAAGVHEYGEQALTILRELGVQWAIGFALNTLALGAYSEGDLTRALTLIRESEALFRGLQADASLAEVLITLGKIERARGNNAAAYQAMSEALRLAQAVGLRVFVPASLEGLASVAAAGGQADQSVRYLAAAAALRRQMGTPVWPVDQATLTNTLATARSALGAAAFAAAWAEAQALPLEQILNTLPIDALPSTTNRPPPA